MRQSSKNFPAAVLDPRRVRRPVSRFLARSRKTEAMTSATDEQITLSRKYRNARPSATSRIGRLEKLGIRAPTLQDPTALWGDFLVSVQVAAHQQVLAAELAGGEAERLVEPQRRGVLRVDV